MPYEKPDFHSFGISGVPFFFWNTAAVIDLNFSNRATDQNMKRVVGLQAKSIMAFLVFARLQDLRSAQGAMVVDKHNTGLNWPRKSGGSIGGSRQKKGY